MDNSSIVSGSVLWFIIAIIATALTIMAGRHQKWSTFWTVVLALLAFLFAPVFGVIMIIYYFVTCYNVPSK